MPAATETEDPAEEEASSSGASSFVDVENDSAPPEPKEIKLDSQYLAGYVGEYSHIQELRWLLTYWQTPTKNKLARTLFRLLYPQSLGSLRKGNLTFGAIMVSGLASI